MEKQYAVNDGKRWIESEFNIIRREVMAEHHDWAERAAEQLGRSVDSVRTALRKYLKDLIPITRQMGIVVKTQNLPQFQHYRERTTEEKMDLRLYHIERKIDRICAELGITIES